MDQTVVLRLPEQMVERFRRGAAAANKRLEDFLVDRLSDAVPPVTGDLPSPLREELQAMEGLDDDALWRVARSGLPAGRRRRYEELLRKNSEGSLEPGDDATS